MSCVVDMARCGVAVRLQLVVSPCCVVHCHWVSARSESPVCLLQHWSYQSDTFPLLSLRQRGNPIWFVVSPKTAVFCEMSPSQVTMVAEFSVEPSWVMHLVCGGAVRSMGSSSKLVSISNSDPLFDSSVPSHDHVSSSGNGKVHPVIMSVLSLLPTMSWWWCSNAICFPALRGIIWVQVWPLEEAVQLALLLFCERDAQTVYKGFDCHGDLFRFPCACCQFSWCWSLVEAFT